MRHDTKNVIYQTIEEFLEVTWDYISPIVISDLFWDNNRELIMERTLHYFRLHEMMGAVVTPSGQVEARLSPKHCGKMIEAEFDSWIKNYNKIVI